MTILVACFSLTGKTELIAKKLAKSLGADYVSLEPVKWKSKFAAYTVGLLLAQRRSVVEPVADKGVGNEDRYHEILLSQSNCCVVCSRFAETKKVPADDISSTDTFWIR